MSEHHAVRLGGPFFRGHLVPPFVGLTSSEWKLLMVITSFDYSQEKGTDCRSGFSFPGNSALARESGVSEATVKRALRTLEENVYILRTRQHRGRGKRDFRTLHINYGRLERGHRHVLNCRARRSASRREMLEDHCREGFRTDDLDFLRRLISEGAVEWSRLEKKCRDFADTRIGGLIGELASQLEGSSMIVPDTPIKMEKSLIHTSLQRMNEGSEEDEVQSVRRCVQVRRADYSSADSLPLSTTSHGLDQARTCGKPSNAFAARSFRPVLQDSGFNGASLERALAIALHFFDAGGYADTAHFSRMIRDTIAELRWDVETEGPIGLREFAAMLSESAGCQAG